jgi:glutamyl/glutaminyl-tRNA synthetase
VNVNNLEKDRPCIIKVGYTVQDAESFAEDQILQFEALNLSEEAMASLNLAKLNHAAGNYTRAIEFLETVKKISKQDEKELSKLKKKSRELRKKIDDEIQEIGSALQKTDSSSPFVAKLHSRKDELERVLGEANASDASEEVYLLSKVDYKWLSKELNYFKKSAYKEYNDLKERFYAAGNASTPDAFLLFESALHRLETGGRAEYAIDTLDALENAKATVLSQERDSEEDKRRLSLTFENLKSETLDVLDHYSREAAAAKGTEYSSLFLLTSKKVESSIKTAEGSKDGNSQLFALKMDGLNQTKRKLQHTLASLENESRAKLSLIETLSANSNLDDTKKNGVNKKLEAMRRMMAAGEYVNALRAGSSLAKELESHEAEEDNGLLILGVTALAILATIAAYMIKQQKQRKPKRRKLMSFVDFKGREPAVPPQKQRNP